MMVELIEKKKAGKRLSSSEIRYFVDGFTNGEIPDYQASALFMAICFKGMQPEETAELTDAMMHSGQVMDFSSLGFMVADKHSTGGVADTTTLILVPLCACLGVKMAKMSGRGLGHTGGTIDKLESIPGFCVEQSMEEVKALLRKNGAVIVGQSSELAPADKKMYALRDVTATVDSVPLIASSVMSKKLALGADIIVLDVKAGSGAFMQSVDDAFSLAQTMVDIGIRLNKKVAALITNMEQPLGNLIGNAMEVEEAIQILSGMQKDSDLYRVTMALGVQLLRLYGIEAEEQKALAMLKDAISSGKALNQFEAIIRAQGGDPRVCTDTLVLGRANTQIEIAAESDGYVCCVDAASIGRAAQMLGAGRSKLEDVIDPLVGIRMCVRIGDTVKAGQTLAVLHVNDNSHAKEAALRVQEAITIGENPKVRPLIFGIVTAQGQIRY